MNLIIACEVSLSKKMRSILGSGESVVLSVSNINDGRGTGRLTLSTDNTDPIEVESIGETSIMLKPLEVIGDLPGNLDQSVESIFSSLPIKGEKNEVIDKIGVVHPPETKDEVADAMVERKSIKTPKPFQELDIVECKEYVSNLDELMDEVKIAKAKTVEVVKTDEQDINSSFAQRARLAAVELEKKEQTEGINKIAWVVNDKVGKLTINDLDLTLTLNMPFDLSRISSHRIANSNDLRTMFNQKMVRFATPDEISELEIKAIKQIEIPGLDIFNSHEEAEANIAKETMVESPTAMDITDDVAGEEESIMINLTQDMPTTKSVIEKGVRHSSHGHQPPTAQSKSERPQIKRAK